MLRHHRYVKIPKASNGKLPTNGRNHFSLITLMHVANKICLTTIRENRREKFLNLGHVTTITSRNMNSDLDTMAEQVRENIGSLTESLLSESLDVNGSSLALFSDSPFTDNSINLDDSVFDDRDSNRDLNFTSSISENVVNNSGHKTKTDTLKRWYNTGERRFERGIGTNNISNDIISFTPVSKIYI